MITPAEVQETLRDLVTQYGPPNSSNSRMYSSVLKSALANDPREAELIDISLDKQIPGRLFAQKNNPQIIDQLIQELISSHRIDSHASEWIVKTWAKSMGMSVSAYQPPSQKQSYRSQPSSPQYSGGSIDRMSSPSEYQSSNQEQIFTSQSESYPGGRDSSEYGSKQQSPPSNVNYNHSSDQMLCPQCRTPLPKQIGERCTKCGYTATQYAGFLRRFGAAIIDGIVLFIIQIIIELVGFAAIIGIQDNSGIGIILMVVIVLAITVLYYPFFESSEYQGTPGKMALGLKIVDSNFLRISFGKAILRYFGRIVCVLTLGIGYLLILFSDKKQGLHDKIAGTYVIKK